MIKTLIVLLFFVHGSLSGKILLKDVASNESDIISEAQAFFESIPPQDRDSFIIYYLDKGLREQTANSLDFIDRHNEISMFDGLVEPENFSSDLLNWVKEEFEMENQHVKNLVLDGVVCLNNGKCVNPSDVGSNCCLF